MIINFKNTEKTVSLLWSISKACNLNCSYCIQRGNVSCQVTKGIDKEESIRVAQHLKILFDKCGYKEISMSITGGEPSLFDLPEIIDILKGDTYKLKITILTNFTLHDKTWWDSLKKPNTNVKIVASCHFEQIANLEEWLFKAKSLNNIDKFKVKFIVSDENLNKVKSTIEKCISLGLRFSLEGARCKNEFLFGDEVMKFISESNSLYSLSDNNLYIFNNNALTHTELISEIKQIKCDKANCIKRLCITGNTVYSGCPYKGFNDFLIYSLNDLNWVNIECNVVNKCNLCQSGKIEINDSVYMPENIQETDSDIQIENVDISTNDETIVEESEIDNNQENLTEE